MWRSGPIVGTGRGESCRPWVQEWDVFSYSSVLCKELFYDGPLTSLVELKRRSVINDALSAII